MGFPKRTVGSSQRPAKRKRVLSHRPYLSPDFFFCFLHSRPSFRAFHVLLRSLVGREPTYFAFISTHRAHIVAGVLKAEEAIARDLASALVADPLSLKEAWEGEGAEGEFQDGISISLPRSPQKIREPSASHSSRLGSSQLLLAAGANAASISLAFLFSCPHPGTLGSRGSQGQGEGAGARS